MKPHLAFAAVNLSDEFATPAPRGALEIRTVDAFADTSL
jgi:hypothetical protein